MLYDLLDHDIKNFAPRRIVRTQALAEQQEESLQPLDEWWLTLLQNGVLGAGGDAPDEAISNAYEEDIREATGSGFYGNGKRTRAVKREGLYDQARRNSPRLKGCSDAKFGRYLKKRSCTMAWVKRRRGWRFPPLAACRDEWIIRFPEAAWEDGGPSDWTHGEDDGSEA
jgi:hypothetical protein